jgi:hypothetical protein
VKRFGVGAIAAAVLVMTGLVNPAPAAASEDCMRMHNFGSQQRLASIPGAVIVLRFRPVGGLSGWECELQGSVVPPGYGGFGVGVAGVDELGVVAA